MIAVLQLDTGSWNLGKVAGELYGSLGFPADSGRPADGRSSTHHNLLASLNLLESIGDHHETPVAVLTDEFIGVRLTDLLMIPKRPPSLRQWNGSFAQATFATVLPAWITRTSPNIGYSPGPKTKYNTESKT